MLYLFIFRSFFFDPVEVYLVQAEEDEQNGSDDAKHYGGERIDDS
jgi:hypothetical protein